MPSLEFYLRNSLITVTGKILFFYTAIVWNVVLFVNNAQAILAFLLATAAAELNN